MTTKCPLRCPVCDFEAMVRAGTPRFFCKCGTVIGLRDGVGEVESRGDTSTLPREVPPAPAGPFVVRLETCKSCHHYMGNLRCKWIELGCAREFRARLEDREASCPAGKWRQYAENA